MQEVFVKALESERRQGPPGTGAPGSPASRSIPAATAGGRAGGSVSGAGATRSSRSRIVDRGVTPEDTAISSETRRRIWQAFRSLPDRQREVFVLRHVEEWSGPEIAAALGLSPGTVKRHLFRAVHRMRVSPGGRAMSRCLHRAAPGPSAGGPGRSGRAGACGRLPRLRGTARRAHPRSRRADRACWPAGPMPHTRPVPSFRRWIPAAAGAGALALAALLWVEVAVWRAVTDVPPSMRPEEASAMLTEVSLALFSLRGYTPAPVEAAEDRGRRGHDRLRRSRLARHRRLHAGPAGPCGAREPGGRGAPMIRARTWSADGDAGIVMLIRRAAGLAGPAAGQGMEPGDDDAEDHGAATAAWRCPS